MPALVQNGIPIFTDIDGDPLEDGYIYIGEAGLNPLSNPLQAYWDSALTIPTGNLPTARTKGGAASYNGTPARLYVPANYSIIVQDKKQRTVYSILDSIDFSNSLSGESVSAVNTLTELRGLLPLGNGSAVRLKGYSNIYDSEDVPLYIWDQTATDSDNGSSVIKPDAVEPGDPGRWVWGSRPKIMSELRAVTYLYDGRRERLEGYYVPGDVHFPRHYYDSTSTLDDNGGSVIKPDSISAANPGRWLLPPNLRWNVKWFGAKGDSDGATGTDDTVAIQTAIDFLSYNGGEVYFPNGRYLVTTINPMSSGITVNIYPPTIAGGQINKVILSGDGYGSSELISIGGNVLEPIDRSDPIPATPARLTLEVKGLAITGDISVTDAQKTGKGFYADTTKISMSYIYFKDCMFKYHAEAFNYLGYEGTGPLADGHTIIENCIIADNTLGVITAVDNVMLVNNYISRNSYYGVWFREGRAIQVVGGKIQLNGQDNFGTGDIFTKAGQVLIGGTTQRDDNIGDIQFKSVYWESALESGNNPKHAFIDIEQEDTTARTMIVSNITIDGGFVNGKDCANFIRLENNCVVSNLTIKALQAVNFNLPDNSLVELLGGDARLLKADLSIDNDLSLKDDTDTSIPSDAVKLKTIYETNPNVNYNIKNQLGVKAVQVLGAAIADAATITTAVVAIQERAVYRITIDDVFISGGNETVNLPYVGLFVVTLFQEKQQDIVNTGYTITVDGSRNIVITNNTGGARQFGYTIERIL